MLKLSPGWVGGGLLACALALSGCEPMKPEDFKDSEPVFKPESFFEGKTLAWGIFEDRFGTVRRQFSVDITGTWDGTLLTLVEDFLYDDGETEQRIWKIRKTGESTYEGEADGVAGIATGVQAGSAMNWQYDFDLKVGDSVWRVHFDDWMLLQADGVMLNRAVVTKFGFTLGTATIAFRKEAASEAAARPIEPSAATLAAAE